MERVEIQHHGIFNVRYNYLHRGLNPRLVLEDKGRFKAVQFDRYDKFDTDFQKGYDFNGQDIKLRLIDDEN